MECSLLAEAAAWRDTVEYNKDVVERFTALVNEHKWIAGHRDYIEHHGYGFGERCFHWMWWLIVSILPQRFRFLEVGVYKGQVLSLVRLFAEMQHKDAYILGITPLSTTSGPEGKFPEFPDEDYRERIRYLHKYFGLEQPNLAVGRSQEKRIQDVATVLGPFDVVYIDGCHEYDSVVSDLVFYPELVKLGGFLVVDDSGCYLNQPAGYFQGIEDVSRAVRTVIETDPRWAHWLAVMHNRLFWRREGP